MVFFMDTLETDKVSDGHSVQLGEQNSDTEKIAVLMQSLPFVLDRSFVYHIHEFKLTLLTSGFFGDIFKVMTEYFTRYFSGLVMLILYLFRRFVFVWSLNMFT